MQKSKEFIMVICKNKSAYFNYNIIDEIEAGIVLTGTEVKSCRLKNVSILESYAAFESGELFLYQANIARYSQGNISNHEPTAKRKLLLHKKEIIKLEQVAFKQQMTIVPLKLYLKRGKIKCLIGTGKGKKEHDKRESIKRRQADINIKTIMKRKI